MVGLVTVVHCKFQYVVSPALNFNETLLSMECDESTLIVITETPEYFNISRTTLPVLMVHIDSAMTILEDLFHPCLTILVDFENAESGKWYILHYILSRGSRVHLILLVRTIKDGEKVKETFANIGSTSIVLREAPTKLWWTNLNHCPTKPYKAWAMPEYQFSMLLDEETGKLVGRDDTVFQEAERKLNWSVLPIQDFSNRPGGLGGISKNMTAGATGIHKAILSGNGDILLGGWTGTYERRLFYKYIPVSGAIDGVFSATSTAPLKHLLAVLSPFELPVWLCILFATVTTTLITGKLLGGSFDNFLLATLNTIRPLINQTVPSYPPSKFLSGLWFMFGLVLSIAFSSAFIAQISVPLAPPRLDKFSQLEAIGEFKLFHKYYGEGYVSPHVRNLGRRRPEYFNMLKQRAHGAKGGYEESIVRTLAGEGGVLGSKAKLKFLAKDFSKFYLMKESELHSERGLLVRRQLCGSNELEKLVLRMRWFGLVDYWTTRAELVGRRQRKNIMNNGNSVEKYSSGLQKILPIVELLALGVMFSSLVFVLEILWKRSE